MTSAPAQKKLAADQTAFLKVQPLADVLTVLNGEGEETRVVGGAVRNLLLGLPARRNRSRDHGAAEER